MIRTYFSGIFLLLFMLVSLVMTGLYAPEAIKKTETPTLDSLMKGTWSPVFEKSLGDALPISQPVRNFWGRTEFILFREGRSGVLIGQDNWLFTDEEFSCLSHAKQNFEQNLQYISEVQKIMSGKNVKLVVAVIPAKARFYQTYLGVNRMTDCRKNIYKDIMSYLLQNKIESVDLLQAFNSAENRDSLFLRTDTHWAPEGARVAADAIAKSVSNAFLSTLEALPHKDYLTRLGEQKEHRGDLTRYTPGVTELDLSSDKLITLQTEQNIDPAQVQSDDLGLFGDDTPKLTLVGTSYSANVLWNFAGYLKEYIKADVLNMADEGLGPFTVMNKYLESKAWKDSPPSIVIWEIPERYTTTPQEFLKTKLVPSQH